MTRTARRNVGEIRVTNGPLARLRGAIACVAIFAAALTIYLANGETISSYDAVPNSLLAFNVLERGTLDFDRFRGSYFAGLGGDYAFVEAPNGHLTSLFPIGTALVTLPVYAALYAVERPSDIAAPSFEGERQRDEKLAAAIVAALSAVLIFLCARFAGNAFQAGVVTLAFALGSETWMIGSQGLWQHGSVNLVLLGMIYALLRARPGWLCAAGVLAGFLPVVRPTAVLFSIAGALFVVLAMGRRSRPFFLGAVVGLAPGLAWNAYFFHSLTGGYAGNLALYDGSLRDAGVAFAGLLVSPSRGLAVFTPLVVFSVFGALRAARRSDAAARLLTLLAGAAVVLTLQYAFFRIWVGGHTYGPRFLTDAMAVAALLLVYVVPADPRAYARSNPVARLKIAAFVVLLGASIAVQAIGAFSGAAGPLWNTLPLDIARAPDRIWGLADSQIERNARATYYHYVPDYPTAGPAYAAGFAGRVLAVHGAGGTALAAPPGAKLDLTAIARNDGLSRWYGYASAVYNGEARIRVRVADAGGRVRSEGMLYVDGSPAAGDIATARGTIVAPSARGSYTAIFEPIAFGIPALEERSDAGAFRSALTVR
jgi:hypothetical protein